MSGILDSKVRIIDAIVTLEGRRQLADGDLRIEHVSFTDTGTYYSADLVSGSSDATSRIFLEAAHLPQDQITFESDDSGRLKPFKNGQGLQVKDGQILSYSFEADEELITGSLENVEILKGDAFASTAQTLLESSLENFQRMQLIATRDRLFEDEGFGIGSKEIEFVLTNKRPITHPNRYSAHISQIESLFNDPRLSHVKNFRFLPPINRTDDENIDKSNYKQTARRQLGPYRPWGRTNLKPLTFGQIKFELKYFEQLGYCKTINIDPTSKENRLVCQFFEKNYNQLTKLDVIDYGRMPTGDPRFPVARVFFAGKIMLDDNETHTFIHLFTLVFD